MEEFKIERSFDVLDKPFKFVDSKTHVPTIKISLSACTPDDSSAWDHRDWLESKIRELLHTLTL